MAEQDKIFLVEDDANFGGVLKAYLEMDNYDVTWVNDGREALKTFEKDRYAICILDVMLPNIDGFSIAKKIKETEESIPLIFLTAKTLREDVLQGYEIGADDYITKPFDSEVLLYKLKATANLLKNYNILLFVSPFQNSFLEQHLLKEIYQNSYTDNLI